MTGMAKLAALALALDGDLPRPVARWVPRKPSGKDRSKAKAARKANQKRRQAEEGRSDG